MLGEVTHEAQIRAARQLALHLRQNPEEAQREPGELADQFGLPATFVQNVLSGIQGNARRHASWFPRVDLTWVFRLYQWIERMWERLTVKPVSFIIGSSIAYGAILFLLDVRGSIHLGLRRSEIIGDSSFTLILFLVTFGLHMACLFKRRMVRYALHSALLLWTGLSCVLMTFSWLDMRSSPDGVKAGILLLVAFGMFIVCTIYAGIGAAFSVLGAYMDLRKQAKLDDRMSRQDMLERYFELQERLDESEGLTPRPSFFDLDFVKAFVTTGPFWALLTGLVLNTLMIFIMLASGIDFVRPGGQVNWVVFANLLLGLIAFLSYIAAGFLSRRFLAAVISSLAISIGGLPPVLMGINVFHMNYLKDNYNWVSFSIASFGYLIVTLFGYLGGIVQRRAAEELSLAQNDPASILAEMVRIQWRLSDRTNMVCVMVVDAAKSSEMKSFADPLAVEYSFREYQTLLEDLSKHLDGRVHSTAGDGAVIAFNSAEAAFTAAKRIQTDIERFNREDNRLQLPFRLRVGLHLGEVVGDLDEVEFTEVIDIAAHVQAAAPVGGIAVTERVAEHLDADEFVPLARQVDGQNVLLALNPLVDKPWQTFST